MRAYLALAVLCAIRLEVSAVPRLNNNEDKHFTGASPAPQPLGSKARVPLGLGAKVGDDYFSGAALQLEAPPVIERRGACNKSKAAVLARIAAPMAVGLGLGAVLGYSLRGAPAAGVPTAGGAEHNVDPATVPLPGTTPRISTRRPKRERRATPQTPLPKPQHRLPTSRQTPQMLRERHQTPQQKTRQTPQETRQTPRQTRQTPHKTKWTPQRDGVGLGIMLNSAAAIAGDASSGEQTSSDGGTSMVPPGTGLKSSALDRKILSASAVLTDNALGLDSGVEGAEIIARRHTSPSTAVLLAAAPRIREGGPYSARSTTSRDRGRSRRPVAASDSQRPSVVVYAAREAVEAGNILPVRMCGSSDNEEHDAVDTDVGSEDSGGHADSSNSNDNALRKWWRIEKRVRQIDINFARDSPWMQKRARDVFDADSADDSSPQSLRQRPLPRPRSSSTASPNGRPETLPSQVRARLRARFLERGRSQGDWSEQSGDDQAGPAAPEDDGGRNSSFESRSGERELSGLDSQYRRTRSEPMRGMFTVDNEPRAVPILLFSSQSRSAPLAGRSQYFIDDSAGAGGSARRTPHPAVAAAFAANETAGGSNNGEESEDEIEKKDRKTQLTYRRPQFSPDRDDKSRLGGPPPGPSDAARTFLF